jgi:taurine dioxygenase
MTTAAENGIRFEKTTGTVGALVHGVKLGAATSDTLVSTLQRALHEFGVLFFQFDRLVNAEEFADFSALFGEPEEGYKLTTRKGAEGPYIDSDQVPMKEFRINHWHADGTPLERPPQAAILTPVELPEAGGDTMWASMYAAWEGLSSRYQRLLDGLEVRHGTARLPFLRESPTFVHPAVIRDPVTGRRILYVNSNYAERFVGMSDAESDALLRMLFEHVNTPEFHVRLRWRPGTVAVWEERVTQHRGVADFVGPRKLRRITIVGERPAA